MTTFKKVLIANRGEIALRVISALRKLGISSVAIFHSEDRHALYVRQADEAIEVYGDTPTAAYLDIPQIIQACKKSASDAVHPGYGFLSENAGFARALSAEEITFIGPEADVIELMGDKIVSRNFVEKHGFPVPPSISVRASDLESAELSALRDAVESMGLPVVVKAAAGGGGKGMNIVRALEDLEGSLRVAASEAKKYFHDERVYIERYFPSARHIEVQILGDSATTLHLGVRECSIQRRFQKVIEEAPSPALSEQKHQEICEVALGIARAARYSSAGTVEFLYTPEGEFFFLEMNTRIQVEHPVTEMIYGVDIVAEQIRVAMGEGLTFTQDDLKPSGHAIECRICAEDPFNNFMPETGKVLYLNEPSGDGIRVDSGLHIGQVIGSSFDPMLAKIIVHAPSRSEAIGRLRDALENTVILGVTVNIEYLQHLLDHPKFQVGDFDTGFIASEASELERRSVSQDDLQAVLATAYLTDRDTRLLVSATPEPYLAIGNWRN
ncbi:ATP-grasp domain-containing protein [Spongiibacter nanhainus]|uniref:Biotin carboxylase n=1 Tax=Spongiibacter nanhainus TaxID=2794344 RepID=A0A7T4R1L4_9GAMM|nr:biotin carboxylase N-terminal domain-containing protein [Spongiibacter nanhainus]QQD18582.1 ATP-grasp domain-containing protein [Spongiibacter nanhainus]